MIIDLVHGVGHSPVSQILLQMIVRAEIMASPPFILGIAFKHGGPRAYYQKDVDNLEKIQRRATRMMEELRGMEYDERLRQTRLGKTRCQ